MWIIWTSQTFSCSFGVNLPSLYSVQVRVVGFLCVYHCIHPMFIFIYLVYFAFFKCPRRWSGLLVKSCFLIQMLIPRYVTQWKIYGAEHFLFLYFSTYMLCYNNFKILESQSCNREDKTSTGKAKVLLEKSRSQRQYWTSKSRLYICSFSWYK